MKNRKLVTTPVQEGSVKAKPGDIGQPEQGTDPKIVDVPPPGAPGSEETGTQIRTEP